jgi:hypothetical protein
MIDFPTSPAVGTIVTSPTGIQWRWSGGAWEIVQSPGVATDTRGYTFVQAGTPTATRIGDTWYQPAPGDGSSGGAAYVWSTTTADGSGSPVWRPDPATLADARLKMTRSAMAYPGHNAPITYNNVVLQAGPSIIYTSGASWYVSRTGLYSISYMVTWGGSSAPAVCASWIYQIAPQWRHMSSQVDHGRVNVGGWTTGGSTVLKLGAGDGIQVQVYNPSGAPPGIEGSELNMVLIA